MMSVTAEKFRWTVERFRQATEAGVLSPDDHYELIEGELITVVPPKPSHTAIVKRLHRSFLLSLTEQAYDVSSQQPIDLGPESHPEPDVMVAKGPPSRFDNRHPTPADMLLVVEVADTSLRYDREIKATLYARHAIPELWVVDVNGHVVEVHREPSDVGYRKVRRQVDGSLTPSRLSDVVVDLATVFADPAG